MGGSQKKKTRPRGGTEGVLNIELDQKHLRTAKTITLLNVGGGKKRKWKR